MAEEITLKQLGRIVRQRLNNRWDFNCAISGAPGVGKSTMAVKLSKKIDKNYRLDKNVAFFPKPKDIIPHYERLQPKQCLHIDEASSIHKHQWFNPVIQQLAKHFDTERWQTKATVFCIPRFWNLTENFRNDRILMWIHVLDRGVASVNIRDDDKYQFDPWHLKKNMKIRNSMKMRSVINQTTEDRIQMESKNPNFVGIVRFPDMEEQEKEEYEQRKIESRKKRDDEEQEEEQVTQSQQRLYDAFRWDALAGMDDKTLSKKYGYEIGYIMKLRQKLDLRKKDMTSDKR